MAKSKLKSPANTKRSMEPEQPKNTDENCFLDAAFNDDSPSVPSPPSIPVIVTLSDSWSKEDDVSLKQSDAKESPFHTYPTHSNISSLHEGKERSSTQSSLPKTQHSKSQSDKLRIKHPSILVATPNNRSASKVHRKEAQSSTDKTKSVNFAPSTQMNHNESHKSPTHSNPHYYRSGPPTGYFGFASLSSPSTSMNYNNNPGQMPSYHLSSSHTNAFFGPMYSHPRYIQHPYPSASSTPGRNNAHINPSEHEIRAAVEASTNVLRSPPPKKRRVKESPSNGAITMGSWDDDEDHVGVMSPSVFRSPKDDFKASDQLLMDLKRSPGLVGDNHDFDSASFGSKDDDDFFRHSSSFDIDPHEKTPNIAFDKDDDKMPDRSPLDFDFSLSPMGMTPMSKSQLKKSEPVMEIPSPLEHKFPSPLPMNEIYGKHQHLPPHGIQQNYSRPLFEDFLHAPPEYIHNRRPQSHNPSPGFRMKIGEVGYLNNAENRLGLNTLNNSMNRGTPSDRRSVPQDMQTPMKAGIHITSTPSTGNRSLHNFTYTGSSAKPSQLAAPNRLHELPQSRNLMITATPARSTSSDASLQAVTLSASEKEEDRKTCHCKRSQCLKLYCDCFAAQVFCDGCKCSGCKNNEANRETRDKAVKETIAKNSMAFKPRVPVTSEDTSGNKKGCNCKNSGCLKKYCVCYTGGFTCGETCKCLKCSNFSGSKDLRDRRLKDANAVTNPVRRPLQPVKDLSLNRRNDNSQGTKPIVAPPRPVYPSHFHQLHQSNSLPPSKIMTPQQYMDSQSMVRKPCQSLFGYSPMPFIHGTPAQGYTGFSQAPLPTPQIRPNSQHVTPQSRTPKTPRGRRDPASATKKGKDADIKADIYFGLKNGSMPRSLGLGVMSYLSNEELYNASLVSKRWCSLALDDGLWEW